MVVADLVTVTFQPAEPASELGPLHDASLLVEWEGGRMGDCVADAVVAVLLQVGGWVGGLGRGLGSWFNTYLKTLF